MLSYKGGSNLSQQLTADTLHYDATDLIKKGDTIFLKHNDNDYLFFYQISGNTDYRLILPANGMAYSITGSRKGPDADSFYSETECLVKATPVIPLTNTHVNRQSVNPVIVGHDLAERFIFLNK